MAIKTEKIKKPLASFLLFLLLFNNFAFAFPQKAQAANQYDQSNVIKSLLDSIQKEIEKKLRGLVKPLEDLSGIVSSFKIFITANPFDNVSLRSEQDKIEIMLFPAVPGREAFFITIDNPFGPLDKGGKAKEMVRPKTFPVCSDKLPALLKTPENEDLYWQWCRSGECNKHCEDSGCDPQYIKDDEKRKAAEKCFKQCIETKRTQQRQKLNQACSELSNIQSALANQTYFAKQLYIQTDPLSNCLFLRNCRTTCALSIGGLSLSVNLIKLVAYLIPGLTSAMNAFDSAISQLNSIKDNLLWIETVYALLQKVVELTGSFMDLAGLVSSGAWESWGDTKIWDFVNNLMDFYQAKQKALERSQETRARLQELAGKISTDNWIVGTNEWNKMVEIFGIFIGYFIEPESLALEDLDFKNYLIKSIQDTIGEILVFAMKQKQAKDRRSLQKPLLTNDHYKDLLCGRTTSFPGIVDLQTGINKVRGIVFDIETDSVQTAKIYTDKNSYVASDERLLSFCGVGQGSDVGQVTAGGAGKDGGVYKIKELSRQMFMIFTREDSLWQFYAKFVENLEKIKIVAEAMQRDLDEIIADAGRIQNRAGIYFDESQYKPDDYASCVNCPAQPTSFNVFPEDGLDFKIVLAQAGVCTGGNLTACNNYCETNFYVLYTREQCETQYMNCLLLCSNPGAGPNCKGDCDAQQYYCIDHTQGSLDACKTNCQQNCKDGGGGGAVGDAPSCSGGAVACEATCNDSDGPCRPYRKDCYSVCDQNGVCQTACLKFPDMDWIGKVHFSIDAGLRPRRSCNTACSSNSCYDSCRTGYNTCEADCKLYCRTICQATDCDSCLCCRLDKEKALENQKILKDYLQDIINKAEGIKKFVGKFECPEYPAHFFKPNPSSVDSTTTNSFLGDLACFEENAPNFEENAPNDFYKRAQIWLGILGELDRVVRHLQEMEKNLMLIEPMLDAPPGKYNEREAKSLISLDDPLESIVNIYDYNREQIANILKDPFGYLSDLYQKIESSAYFAGEIIKKLTDYSDKRRTDYLESLNMPGDKPMTGKDFLIDIWKNYIGEVVGAVFADLLEESRNLDQVSFLDLSREANKLTWYEAIGWNFGGAKAVNIADWPNFFALFNKTMPEDWWEDFIQMAHYARKTQWTIDDIFKAQENVENIASVYVPNHFKAVASFERACQQNGYTDDLIYKCYESSPEFLRGQAKSVASQLKMFERLHYLLGVGMRYLSGPENKGPEKKDMESFAIKMLESWPNQNPLADINVYSADYKNIPQSIKDIALKIQRIDWQKFFDLVKIKVRGTPKNVFDNTPEIASDVSVWEEELEQVQINVLAMINQISQDCLSYEKGKNFMDETETIEKLAERLLDHKNYEKKCLGDKSLTNEEIAKGSYLYYFEQYLANYISSSANKFKIEPLINKALPNTVVGHLKNLDIALTNVMDAFGLLIGVKETWKAYQAIRAIPKIFRELIKKSEEQAQQEVSAEMVDVDYTLKCASAPAKGAEGRLGAAGGPVCPRVAEFSYSINSAYARVQQSLRNLEIITRVKKPIEITIYEGYGQKQEFYGQAANEPGLSIKEIDLIFALPIVQAIPQLMDVYNYSRDLGRQSRNIWGLGIAMEFANQNCTCGWSFCMFPVCLSGLPLTPQAVSNAYCLLNYILRIPIWIYSRSVEESLKTTINQEEIELGDMKEKFSDTVKKFQNKNINPEIFNEIKEDFERKKPDE